MTDETEQTLVHLFAEANPAEPTDEPFVAAISGRIARRRRAAALLRVAGSLAGVAAAASAPFVAGPATSIALLPNLMAEPMEALLLSPAGWVAGLLLSVLFVWRGSA